MRTRNYIMAVATASLALLSCEQQGPNTPPDEPDVPVTTVPQISIAVVDSTETSLTFTITPTNAREVAYQLLDAGAEIPGAEEILSNGTAVDTVRADYTVSDLVAGTTYIIAAAARNADTLSDVAHIEATTKVEATVPDPDPVPTVTIASITPRREGVTFTYTQQDAEDMAYMVVASSEQIPTATQILENGTAIDLQSETVTMESGLTAYTGYLLAIAARHGEEYSEVAYQSFTTLRSYYIDQDVDLVFNAISIEPLTNNTTDASRYKMVFSNDEGWKFEARIYAYLTADGSTIADGEYVVSTSREAGNLEVGDVELGWYYGSFLEQELGDASSRSDNLFGPLTSGTMTVTNGYATFDFVVSGLCTFTGSSSVAISFAKTSYTGSTLTEDYHTEFEGWASSSASYFDLYLYEDYVAIEVADGTGDKLEVVLLGYGRQSALPIGTFYVQDDENDTDGKLERGYATSTWLTEGTGLEIRPNGYNSQGGRGGYTLAPAYSGWLSITDNGDGTYTIEFDFYDDIDNNFTGTYTGEAPDIYRYWR